MLAAGPELLNFMLRYLCCPRAPFKITVTRAATRCIVRLRRLIEAVRTRCLQLHLPTCRPHGPHAAHGPIREPQAALGQGRVGRCAYRCALRAVPTSAPRAPQTWAKMLSVAEGLFSGVTRVHGIRPPLLSALLDLLRAAIKAFELAVGRDARGPREGRAAIKAFV
jgi:hypothetical protein